MDTLALVMAAGEGTRMLSSMPKLLHSVCGMPMVEHVLRALDAVVKEKVLIVGHGRERIMETLDGQADFVVQDSTTGWGTGHAVLSAMARLEGLHGQVIVTAGDKPLVLPETYARLIDEVRRGSACALLTDVVQNPFAYGRVIRKDGRVCAVARQYRLTGEQYMIKEVSSSVYCFDIDALRDALALLTEDNPEHEKHLDDVVGILSGKGLSITAVPALEKCECLGVNDRVQLAEAERAMRLRINTRHMRSGVTIIDPEHTYIQPGVTISPDVVIHPGCTLERGTTVGLGCVLRGARLAGAHIGAGARIEQSIILDARVEAGQKIGPFAVLGPGKHS